MNSTKDHYTEYLFYSLRRLKFRVLVFDENDIFKFNACTYDDLDKALNEKLYFKEIHIDAKSKKEGLFIEKLLNNLEKLDIKSRTIFIAFYLFGYTNKDLTNYYKDSHRVAKRAMNTVLGNETIESKMIEKPVKQLTIFDLTYVS